MHNHSFTLLWFKRVQLSPATLALPERLRHAALLHEEGHCAGHHTEWRILLWPIALWLAKQQEYWADAYVARKGYGPELLELLKADNPGGPFHPSNCQRRQKLMHNKLFDSSTLRAEPGTGSAHRTVGVTNLES